MRVLRSLQGLLLALILLLLVVDLGFLSRGTLSRAVGVGENEAARFWDHAYFHLGDSSVTPSFLVKAVLLLALVVLFSTMTRRLLLRRVLVHFPINKGQQDAIARFAGYLVFALWLVIALQVLGVNLSSLAVVGGALGIGIGFGLQKIVGDFVSGIVLLFERPIKSGDRVEVGQLNGDVVRMGTRSTWVRTNDNVVIIIPNSEFINNRVINWTGNDRQVRFSLPVGVSYDSDPEQVRQLLLQVAACHRDILAEPAPDVLFNGFGENSLNFELRIWTVSRVQTPGVLKSELYFHIFQVLRDNRIEIPFPQRDLRIRSVPPGFDLA